MKNEEKNVTANRAKEIRHHLWNILRDGKFEKDLMLQMAEDNEGSIYYEAQKLDNNIETAILRLQEAQSCLRLGHINSLNGCGILQSLNTEIDISVNKIQENAKKRTHYKEFITE
jgi:hypothetical protein